MEKQASLTMDDKLETLVKPNFNIISPQQHFESLEKFFNQINHTSDVDAENELLDIINVLLQQFDSL